MKKAIAILSGLLCAVACAWAGMDVVPLATTTFATTSTVQASGTFTNDAKDVSGWVDCIRLDVTGTNTGRVDIVTVGGTGGGPSKTILSVSALSADGDYYVRIPTVQTTAGANVHTTAVTRLPLFYDQIVMRCYNTTSSSATFTVQGWLIYSDNP